MRSLGSERGLLAIGAAATISLLMATYAGFQQFAAVRQAKDVAARVDDFEGFYGADIALHSIYFRLQAETATPTGFISSHGGTEVDAAFQGQWTPADLIGSAYSYNPVGYTAGTPVGGQYTLGLDVGQARIRRMAPGVMKTQVPPSDPLDPNRIAPGNQTVCGTYELPSGTYVRCISGSFAGTTTVTITANAVPNLLNLVIPQDPSSPTLPCMIPSVDIAWTSTNATGCTITAFSDPGIVPGPGTPATPTVSTLPAVWTGTAGSETVVNLTADHRFRATCVNGATTVVSDVVIQLGGVNALSLASHILFSTRQRWTGDLGGLAGADARCQAAAVAAGLRPWATWRAILSDDTTNASSRIPIVGTVKSTCWCGALVANNAAQFWTFGNWTATGGCNEYSWDNTVGHGPPGKTPLYAAQCAWPPHGAGGKHTWSGTNLDGTRVPGQNCSNWTAASPAVMMAGGDANAGDNDRFCDGGECAHPCDQPLMLYCISL